MNVVPENVMAGGPGQPGAAWADNLRPGQRLGRYTLLAPVAQGGMARVWAAHQAGTRGFQKMVAIKTIMPALAADAEFERMFLDEARLASAIHHPNVCEILDLGEEGNVLFLAMEWVDGVPLLALLKARPRMPLPDPIALRIVADACAGLHAAHELRNERGEYVRVVHRDVSPHNILVTSDGMVKVTDFGVAKALGLDHAPTMAGQLKGKVAYMSPEQAVGDTTLDRRSDIFSLGAVLYETVTGHRAWPGTTDVLRLQNLLSGNIVHPRRVRPDLPSDLEQILAQSMALDRMQRFQTAEHMRVALEQFLVNRGTFVTPADVARVVLSVCGREVEEQRARIKAAWSAVAEEGSGTSQVSRSVPGVEVRRRAGRGMRKTTAAAITVLSGGMTIAGLLGIVAVGSIPRRGEAQPGASAVSAAGAAGAASSAATPQLSETVTVSPTPPDAVVELNGVVIGTGRQKFARPAPGVSLTVVVKTQGRAPATITIGHDAQAEWTVELAQLADAAPATPPPPPPAKPPPAGGGTQPPAKQPGGGTRPPDKGKGAAIPVNPY